MPPVLPLRTSRVSWKPFFGNPRDFCWWEEFPVSTTSGLEGKSAPSSLRELPPPNPATRGCGARYGCVCVCFCGEGVWKEGYQEPRGRWGARVPVTKIGVVSLPLGSSPPHPHFSHSRYILGPSRGSYPSKASLSLFGE